MIKLKTEICGYDEKNGYVECKKFNVKNTNTMEHLVAIHLLVMSIMENDKNMNINELCKIIKENYQNDIKEIGVD